MRILFLFLALTACASLSHAQEQERKLVERLLRPDMTLVNSAQGRKFVGAEAMQMDKKFAAKSFQAVDKETIRSFSGGKDFSVKDFQTTKFSRSQWAANTKTDAETGVANAEFVTGKSSLNRAAAGEGRVAKTRSYSDSRPFLATGTRQKILNQEDKPLTIDEIRELLNRSK